jgi:hypothetical protein
MSLILKWRHKDGSVVQFSIAGWKSSDPAKSRWLNQMSNACSSTPTISIAIRIWLKQYCRPIEIRGEGTAVSGANGRNESETGTHRNCFPSAEALPNQGSGKQAKRRARISVRTIENACDEFFRSRGMSVVNDNVWRRDKGAPPSSPAD